MASTTASPGTAITAETPTASEILVRDFLAANPSLEVEPGDIELMTDRYTNAEWAKQIAETQKVLLDEAGKGKRESENVRKYDAPQPASKAFAETIDHTVLKLDATTAQIDSLCSEARTEGFKSVCVRLNFVQRCVTNLKGTSVVVACVVGFHEGTQDTILKLREARAAVAAGASELDVVLNHGILTANSPSPFPQAPAHRRDSTADTITWKNTLANSKTSSPPPSSSGSFEDESALPNYSSIYKELATIRSLCPPPTVIKLILETSQLSPAQIVAASHLAAAANFDFIKTSTGFKGPGAQLPDVQLMVSAAEYLSTKTKSNRGSPVRGTKMQVKAAGGIRSLDDAVKMLEAGATRLGTSSGLWIMQEGRAKVEQKGEGRPKGITRLYTDDSVGGY